MAWTTPTDRTTGYVVTAADWNIVEDDLTFLYGDTAYTAVSSFSNSWVNFGSGLMAAGYRLVGTQVRLRGCIKSGTIGSAAFTLPVGYRPTAEVGFACGSNNAFGLCTVMTSGVVTPAVGSNVSFFLDTVAFDTI